MNETKEYYFENVRDLIHYLFSNYGELSPLKLQKGLYFLFAYYGALYGNNREEEKSAEIGHNYPKFLFNADFEAWNYGPVIREVYFENKEGKYRTFTPGSCDEDAIFHEDQEVKSFIDEISNQVVATSDFSLVDRSHEDEVWKRAHKEGQRLMPKEEIVNEYSQEYTQ